MTQFIVIVISFFIHWHNQIEKSSYTVIIDSQQTIKENAFVVLKENCNTCHEDKRKASVFTLDNMNAFSNAIDYQVFIKKRMPKGRKNQLTEVEAKTLKIWLNSLKNQ